LVGVDVPAAPPGSGALTPPSTPDSPLAPTGVALTPPSGETLPQEPRTHDCPALQSLLDVQPGVLPIGAHASATQACPAPQSLLDWQVGSAHAGTQNSTTQ
jgi:hypothetical protein